MSEPVRGRSAGCVRFAPSPSGRMHLGNVASALLGWVCARSFDVAFKVRLEDLDARCDEENSRTIISDLKWLGLDFDEVMMTQRDAAGRYKAACDIVAEAGLVYPCFCSRADLHAASAPHAADGTYVYAGTCKHLSKDDIAKRRLERPPALRLDVGDAFVSCRDEVFGDCSQDLKRDCGDFVIVRSDGVFAYQLVCVVDDAYQGVGTVVRGRDLLSSVARQCYLIDLLGYTRPTYGHHPLLLSEDGRRLSKRDRDCDLGALRELGARPEDIIGLCAFSLGLANADESVGGLRASDLVGDFSWSSVRRRDQIIGKSLLELFGLA